VNWNLVCSNSLCGAVVVRGLYLYGAFYCDTCAARILVARRAILDAKAVGR
jgi:hypothetical protein